MRSYDLIITDENENVKLDCTITVENHITYDEAIELVHSLIDNCKGGRDFIRN